MSDIDSRLFQRVSKVIEIMELAKGFEASTG